MTGTVLYLYFSLWGAMPSSMHAQRLDKGRSTLKPSLEIKESGPIFPTQFLIRRSGEMH